jgi:hypothetical protein
MRYTHARDRFTGGGVGCVRGPLTRHAVRPDLGWRIVEPIKGTDGQPIGPSIDTAQLFWLPPATPFGNLQLKLLMIVARLGHAM